MLCIALLCVIWKLQCSLVQELILYKFELGHNAVEAIRNLYVKGEGAVGHSTVQMVHLGHKKLDNSAKSGRPKTMDSIDANLESSTWIQHHSPVWFDPFMTSVKANRAAELCLILQICWLILVFWEFSFFFSSFLTIKIDSRISY